MSQIRSFALSRSMSRRPLQQIAGGALLVVAAALIGQPAFAQGGAVQPQAEGHPHHQHKYHRHAAQRAHGAEMGGLSPRRIGRMLDAVGATEAQRVQIGQIVAAAGAQLKPLREQSRALREQSRQVMMAPTIVEGTAEQLRSQTVALHDRMSQIGLRAMLDVAQQLTPEQRAKAGELMAQRQERMRQRMQRHHPQGAASTPNS